LGVAVADVGFNVFASHWWCPGAPHWRVASWSGAEESVLFDARSGQTHYLAPLASAVLELLSDQPKSGDDIFESLSPEVESTELEALRVQLADVLLRLEAAGLADQWR
jgi:PqqD family protein of HPr-rel-A system